MRSEFPYAGTNPTAGVRKVGGHADNVAIVRLWQRDTAQWTPEVVIVEPDTLLSEMLQYGLRNMGHSCRAVDTGSDALELLRRMPPTARPVLVITDVELAGVDGHSLHERLRVERPGAFEFVFLTNHGSEGEHSARSMPGPGTTSSSRSVFACCWRV